MEFSSDSRSELDAQIHLKFLHRVAWEEASTRMRIHDFQFIDDPVNQGGGLLPASEDIRPVNGAMQQEGLKLQPLNTETMTLHDLHADVDGVEQREEELNEESNIMQEDHGHSMPGTEATSSLPVTVYEVEEDNSEEIQDHSVDCFPKPSDTDLLKVADIAASENIHMPHIIINGDGYTQERTRSKVKAMKELWKNRCATRYENRKTWPRDIIRNIKLHIRFALTKAKFHVSPTQAEDQILHSYGFHANVSPQQGKLVRWIPPIDGFCLNVDGASKDHLASGVVSFVPFGEGCTLLAETLRTRFY
ncbi:hypothetical protein Taro_030300 [Colocasia esculenta]|uniref:Uncharacterized protein n=1 Tax=Colocasia esculenta TaxID=4460 RepID=A0A843VL34_COLES|nr:hypothetical protein [Colocasia esculenta]